MERTKQSRDGAPVGVAELGERIDRWRRTRGKPCRMPEGLWRAAARLAEKHGLNRVAAPLRLDYYNLKRWVEEGTRRASASVPKPTFVEVRPAAAPAGSVLELEKPGGKKLTLRLSAPLDVVALAEAFWRTAT